MEEFVCRPSTVYTGGGEGEVGFPQSRGGGRGCCTLPGETSQLGQWLPSWHGPIAQAGGFFTPPSLAGGQTPSPSRVDLIGTRHRRGPAYV